MVEQKELPTRQRILEAARVLFNQKGLENVSLRDIAQHVEISPGNLTYHFRCRDDVVFALYLDLVDLIDGVSANRSDLVDREELTLDQIMQMLTGTFQAFVRYRFLMDDLLQVMRTYPRIQEHYLVLSQRREREMLALFEAMIERGWMLPEPTSGQFQLLTMQLTITGNFLLPSAEVFFSISAEEVPSLFARLLGQLLTPFLTESGRLGLETALS